MDNYYGQLLWTITIDNYYGQLLWTITMDNYCAKLLWRIRCSYISHMMLSPTRCLKLVCNFVQEDKIENLVVYVIRGHYVLSCLFLESNTQ